MRACVRVMSLLMAAALAAPLAGQARGGGFGGAGRAGGWGGAGAGGARWGGGSYHFPNNDWQRGYQGGHAVFGDGVRNSAGNDTRINSNVDRNINVNNNFYNRDYNGWNSAWRNGGYWGSRPWGAGWYGGWGGWGWWGASAAAWGLAGLATGAAISSLVDAAANNSSTLILVPTTSYELNYASVEAVGNFGASFSYSVDGNQLFGGANCQQGLLNGQVPGTADQAQLLNAVCQVAYGNGS